MSGRDLAIVGPTTMLPIKCASWCEDGDGHTRATMNADRGCWGTSLYMRLSLEDVSAEAKGDGEYEFYPSFIGPCARRGFNELPTVYLHFTVVGHGHDGLLDDSVQMTAAEARQLAAHLVSVADEIDGIGGEQ